MRSLISSESGWHIASIAADVSASEKEEPAERDEGGGCMVVIG